MKPQIVCIAQPVIDLGTFVTTVHKVQGESPARGVDSSKRKLSEPAKFLATLAAFHSIADSDPIAALRECGSLCSHIEYTFLIALDEPTLIQLMERGDFKITVSDRKTENVRLAVLTGNLNDFRSASLENCRPEAPPDLRSLFTLFIAFFDKAGFKELWSDASRKLAKDGTLFLELK